MDTDQKDSLPLTVTAATTAAAFSSGTEPMDSKIAYFCQLRKDALNIELSKFGLDTTGTTETLRKRLVNCLLGGESTPVVKTAPFVFPVANTEACMVTAKVSQTVTTCVPIVTAPPAVFPARNPVDFNTTLTFRL